MDNNEITARLEKIVWRSVRAPEDNAGAYRFEADSNYAASMVVRTINAAMEMAKLEQLARYNPDYGLMHRDIVVAIDPQGLLDGDGFTHKAVEHRDAEGTTKNTVFLQMNWDTENKLEVLERIARSVQSAVRLSERAQGEGGSRE